MDFLDLQEKLSHSVEGTQAVDNRLRAIRAYTALETFAGDEVLSEPVEQVLVDLIANLLHLVDASEGEIDFPYVYQTGVRHHYHEVTGKPHPWGDEAPRTPAPQPEPEGEQLRCPECDTYSGTFNDSYSGTVVHSICGREGSLASFTRGTPEYEEAFEGSED